jgi:hypothetical protein
MPVSLSRSRQGLDADRRGLSVDDSVPGVDDWDTARDCLDIRMVQNHEMSDRSTGLPSRLYSATRNSAMTHSHFLRTWLYYCNNVCDYPRNLNPRKKPKEA